MSGFVSTVDARALYERANDLEKRQFPFALAQTLNDAGFAVRTAWRDEMPRVFQNPTAWTLNAVLIRKATKQDPSVEVFLRNEIGDAIPPAQYLQFEVRGGARRPKRSEVLLRAAGVLGAGEFAVPARTAQLDAFGNLPGSTYSAILSDVQAQFDPQQNSTLQSRRRRLRAGGARRIRARDGTTLGDLNAPNQRVRAPAKRKSVYFYNREKRGRLPRGIYRKTQTGFGASLEGILMIVGQPTYSPIYNVFDIANQVFAREFTRRWRDNLNFAVAGLKRPKL